MSYYIKKTNLKKGLYLQIYEGHHDPLKGRTVSTLYRKLGYLDALKDEGYEDPVAYFQKEVDELNAEMRMRREEKKKERKTIEAGSGAMDIGHFMVRKIMDGLGLQRFFDTLQKVRSSFRFDSYEIFTSLVYARIVSPCSKLASYEKVIPYLMGCKAASYDDILSCCEFLGEYYEDYVDLMRASVEKAYGLDMDTAYFDCTNFYFEIDREDDFRKKGKSKENRHNPIVNLGLLLDGAMIPTGMRIYSGEASEKPVIRDVIENLKRQSGARGKIIQVADKGLNCANNILKARINGDGYIFSKSVKNLPEKELAWVFMEDDEWKDVCDANGEIRYSYKSCIDNFTYSPSDEKLIEELKRLGLYEKHNEGGRTVWGTKVREKRVLTFNPDLAKKQIAEIDRMVEKAENLVCSKAKRDEFGECGKFVKFVNRRDPDTRADVVPTLDQDAVEQAKRFCGLNMIVTSESSRSSKDIYSIYHRLWKIEESFRLMKSGLEARPVYLHSENKIKGHFLVCYTAVLLLRILELKLLKNRWGYEKILELIRDLQVLKFDDRQYLNLTPRKTEILFDVSKVFKVHLDSAFFSRKDIAVMGLLTR